MNEEIIEKIEKGKQILYQIENKERQMSSKDIMDGLTYVKDVLIQPFYPEEGVGKRIKYVIDIRDNFLQESQLIKKLDE
jgi:hypothetical protein